MDKIFAVAMKENLSCFSKEKRGTKNPGDFY